MKRFRGNIQKLLKGLCVSVCSVVCVMAVNTLTVSEVMADEKTIYDASVINAEGSYSGRLKGGDYDDYYQFSLNESGKLTLTVEMDTSWGNFYIFNNEYNKLDSYSIVYDSNRRCLYNKQELYFSAGTYYFKFSGSEGAYSFIMDFESADESFPESQTDRNEILSQARSITLDTKYSGVIGYDDEQDFYKFDVPLSGQMSISHRSYGECGLVYYILDIEGNELKSFSADVDKNLGYAHDVDTLPIKAGSYYLKVCGNWKPRYGFYDFSIKVKPSPAQIAQTKRNKTKATVQIEKQEGATGYYLQYSTSSDFKKSVTKTKKSTSTKFKLTGLKKNKIYYVRARAYRTWNGRTYYGEYGDRSTMYSY